MGRLIIIIILLSLTGCMSHKDKEDEIAYCQSLGSDYTINYNKYHQVESVICDIHK